MQQRKAPVLLMVSGGSDSMALLNLAARYVRGSATVAFKPVGRASGSSDDAALMRMLARELPPAAECDLHVLHVNHQLRGLQAEDDEAFVVNQSRNLGIPCEVRRVDVRALAAGHRGGIEAVARQARYRCAREVLDALCEQAGCGAEDGIMCTAHTLDDRIETFYMRSLVGTGPGGLGSIPRRRGRLRRPLLDATREQLRTFLRAHYPAYSDYELWHDDPTNDDGSNFRSQVRTRLMPVLRELRPGFEQSLKRTMDLIASEDADLDALVQGILDGNARWTGDAAMLPADALEGCPMSLKRRCLREFLLRVNPDARLESVQINRICDNLSERRYTTETSGGIRVQIRDGVIRAFIAQ